MPEPTVPSADLGLTWRPISLDDIDVWHRLIGAIEAHDDPTERLDHGDLVDELTAGSYKDPERDSLIGLDGAGVARAFGHQTPLPGATLRRIFLWGGVHPEWRRRGIGDELLRWQTERARATLDEQEAVDPRSRRRGMADCGQLRRAADRPRRRSLGNVDNRAPVVPS